MTKSEAYKAFAAADEAWGNAVRAAKLDRYTIEARGEPHSPLRHLWTTRFQAMREWEIACDRFIGPEVQS